MLFRNPAPKRAPEPPVLQGDAPAFLALLKPFVFGMPSRLAWRPRASRHERGHPGCIPAPRRRLALVVRLLARVWPHSGPRDLDMRHPHAGKHRDHIPLFLRRNESLVCYCLPSHPRPSWARGKFEAREGIEPPTCGL